MRSFRQFFVIVGAAVALLVVLGRDARAQSCSPSTASVIGIAGTVSRVSNGIVPLPDHPTLAGTPIPVNAINYSDCSHDEVLQIPITISGIVSNGSIHVWAGGADCGPLAARTPATQTCWEVMQNVQAQTNPTILSVHVTDIAQFVNAPQGGKPAQYSGTAAPTSVCDTAQTTDSASTISLYIFIQDPQGNVCGSEITYGITVDLKAGALTSAPTSSAGDGLIIVNIPSTTDPNIKYWNVYTDPPPNGAAGSAPTTDAASLLPVCEAGTLYPDVSVPEASAPDTSTATSDAGDDGSIDAASGDDGGIFGGVDASDAGSSAGCYVPAQDAGAPPDLGGATACQSQILVPGTTTTTTDEEGGTTATGAPSSVPGQYLAASVASLTTQYTVTGLVNDTTYTVAVAAVDSVGNVGPLSLVDACGVQTTPNPVGDFWNTYKTDGGQAGGGFCALEGVGMPAGSAAVAGVMLAAALALVRRRRRS